MRDGDNHGDRSFRPVALPDPFIRKKVLIMRVRSPRIRVMAACAIIGILLQCGLCCAQPKTLTILHTNDIHAGVFPHEAGWVRTDPKPLVGGFRELSWTVDSLRGVRDGKGGVLLLDAGDVMTGTPIAEYEYRGAVGGAIFEMMNMIGYDAWTIGNHDLDISQDNLRALAAIAKFPTLSANLTDSAGKLPLNNKEYLILEKNGLRIGIIGLMSEDLFRLTNTNNLKGLKVANAAGTLQRMIDRIGPDTDLLIALTHEGADEDSVLATKIHGLNVIIGGHSHTRIKIPRQVNGVLICQTGSNCENLGQLDLTVENKKVTAYDGRLLTLWARTDRPENELSKVLAEYKLKVDKEFGTVVGTLTGDWKRTRSGESAIGGFITDAIREGASADVALTNSSGIRKDLRAGPITKLDLFEISPFRNYLCTFPVSGKTLRDLAIRYIQSLLESRTSIDLAGLKCTWSRKVGTIEIRSLTAGGKDVTDDGTYTFATTDFVISQGDKYLGFTPAGVAYTKTTIMQAMVAKTQREKQVQAASPANFKEE
jgi:2',3'-cyclic-nucleotide 2'-phosphodiesterase (5'-nucleotidase family)